MNRNTYGIVLLSLHWASYIFFAKEKNDCVLSFQCEQTSAQHNPFKLLLSIGKWDDVERKLDGSRFEAAQVQ